MSTNPYESPIAESELGAATGSSRLRARSTLRYAFLILLVPACYNYYAFDTHVIGGGGIPLTLQIVYRATNLGGIVFGGALIWYLGLPLLEGVAGMIRFVFARHAAIDKWNEALYVSLGPAVLLAIPGMMLWAIWVAGFYYLDLNFVTLSYSVGVPAHIVAACLYLPLLFRWYNLARTTSVQDGRGTT